MTSATAQPTAQTRVVKNPSRGWFLKIFRTVLMYLLTDTPTSSKKNDGANKDITCQKRSKQMDKEMKTNGKQF